MSMAIFLSFRLSLVVDLVSSGSAVPNSSCSLKTENNYFTMMSSRLCLGVVLLAAALVSADAGYPRPVGYPRHIPILKDDRTHNTYGEYSFDFESGNGIARQESGSQSYGQVAQGGWRYTSPEGQQVDIVFVADQGGYQPQGSVLPVPPPLPYTRTGFGF
ncbi:larval cuticle protein LCP-17-like [Penaeus japonicus]|uniref:larval cuticle protein LCP-17-like n=1 Tax=Penaeus japonicus TaxID=27405 RepID=UPI001C715D56|nr:larval cuticle protein LCP-17-like [Penaeus japonicus]